MRMMSVDIQKHYVSLRDFVAVFSHICESHYCEQRQHITCSDSECQFQNNAYEISSLSELELLLDRYHNNQLLNLYTQRWQLTNRISVNYHSQCNYIQLLYAVDLNFIKLVCLFKSSVVSDIVCSLFTDTCLSADTQTAAIQ